MAAAVSLQQDLTDDLVWSEFKQSAGNTRKEDLDNYDKKTFGSDASSVETPYTFDFKLLACNGFKLENKSFDFQSHINEIRVFE